MPKEIVVDPTSTRRRTEIELKAIPVHAYDRSLAEERKLRGNAALTEILRHMMVVREFESMIASFKATGSYRGIEYAYRGPAHLSIGQEAAAVGQAVSLEPGDQIFGSHRSHGEFIAKGMSAFAKMPKEDVEDLMVNHRQGRLADTVDAHLDGVGTSKAEAFLLFGLLAEIFMTQLGFNGGMGGSMHAFYAPVGAYPNNAIVGASAGLATGAALRRKLSRDGGICVANIGDGSTGCGPVMEAMNFASMAQFRQLWQAPFDGGLPVLFFFTNNFYAMGGQTSGETMGWDRLSRIGAGVNQEQMHAETVDGTDPLAVADAVARKRQLLAQRKGPALLDVECYRISGHSTTDANAYRDRDEIRLWKQHDAIELMAGKLINAGLLRDDQVADMKADTVRTIEAVTSAAVNPNIAPPVDVGSNPTLIGKFMFNDTSQPVSSGISTFTRPKGEVAAMRALARKARSGCDEEGNLHSPLRAVTLRDGLAEAIVHHLEFDPLLIAYGEECREWGGAFGVHRGLFEVLPHNRLFNSPISEAAIVATAIGHALAGGRSLVELMYCDFIGRAGDEIFNQLAKWHSMSAGELTVPVVLRASVGSKYGAQHSQDWTGLITHIPGLKAIYPATPFDAKGLMASALSSNDPVVAFESQRLYDQVELFADRVPEEYYRIPIGEPDVKRTGEHITILTFGPSLYKAVAAADELARDGISVEIIDARSLVPFNYDPVLTSIKKTGHLLIVTEASERGSFAMTVAATASRYGFADLKSPPRVLGSPNWIVPGAEMENTYFPQAHDIIDVVAGEILPDGRNRRRGVRNWDDLALARAGL